MPVTDDRRFELGEELPEAVVDDEFEESPLAPFDLSTPRKVADAGDRITAEIEAAHDRYPEAAAAWEKRADLEEFFEIAGLDGEGSVDRTTRERIHWLMDVIAEWLEYVAENGMASHGEVLDIVERFNLESKSDLESEE